MGTPASFLFYVPTFEILSKVSCCKHCRKGKSTVEVDALQGYHVQMS
jgi:hypothetical protein